MTKTCDLRKTINHWTTNPRFGCPSIVKDEQVHDSTDSNACKKYADIAAIFQRGQSTNKSTCMKC